ncbi:MAG: hypothetical protein GXY07_00500 [Candidatus Hydrogenedentes bacterium]|nr:hypothetical protein [Candidatus Hydrogenedentota bacterium]
MIRQQPPLFGHLGTVMLLLSVAVLAFATEAYTEEAPDSPSDAATSDNSQASSQDVPEASPASSTAKTVLHLKGGLPEVLPIPGDPRPYAKSPYANQIDKALAFLAFKDRDSNRLYRLVLLDYLQRKYCLHERYSLKATYAPHLQDASFGDLGNMKRLIDPGFKADATVIENASALERIALKSLYCDIYPVEASLLDEMNTMIQEGMSPFVPTLGIAYLWLRDHGCLAGDPKLMLVRDALAVKLKKHLQDNGLSTYMVGQALALLFEIGHAEMVQEDWIKTVAETQNEEGGWATAPGPDSTGASNGMTTTHLLWALLEHALPNAPATPMVRPATGAKAE